MSIVIAIASWIAFIITAVVFVSLPKTIRDAKSSGLAFLALILSALQIATLVILAGHGLGWW